MKRTRSGSRGVGSEQDQTTKRIVASVSCDSNVREVRVSPREKAARTSPVRAKMKKDSRGIGDGTTSSPPEVSSSSTTRKTSSPESSFSEFTRMTLVESLIARRYRRVSFLVGAGISVAAGIPDFRSPVTGLYAQVRSLGLPNPEDIFSLDCFTEDPKPFYRIAKDFLTYQAQPTAAHRFIRHFEDINRLHMVYTQNIDSLELVVGIPAKKLVQAHGHMQSSRCCRCKKTVSIEQFFASVQNGEVLYCVHCKDPEGIIKPDIIFFGEKLPRSFSQRVARLEKSDLVFVMGTSLKVKPFSELIKSIPDSTHVVVINRDMPNVDRRNVLFLQGEIEDQVLGLQRSIQSISPEDQTRGSGVVAKAAANRGKEKGAVASASKKVKKIGKRKKIAIKPAETDADSGTRPRKRQMKAQSAPQK